MTGVVKDSSVVRAPTYLAEILGYIPGFVYPNLLFQLNSQIILMIVKKYDLPIFINYMNIF